jgi:hypothetical protein
MYIAYSRAPCRSKEYLHFFVALLSNHLVCIFSEVHGWGIEGRQDGLFVALQVLSILFTKFYIDVGLFMKI